MAVAGPGRSEQMIRAQVTRESFREDVGIELAPGLIHTFYSWSLAWKESHFYIFPFYAHWEPCLQGQARFE